MGAMIGSESQRRSFEDRLTRIRVGGEFTNHHVFVGPVDEAVGGRRPRRFWRRAPKLPGPRKRSFFSELFMVPLAIGFGGMAVVAARVGGFHFLTEQPLYLQHSWYASLAIAAILALILRWSFRLSGGMRGKAFFSGFVVMLFFEALFMVRAPEVFEALYSEAYVAELVARIGPA